MIHSKMSRYSTYTFLDSATEAITRLYNHDIREGKFKPEQLKFEDYATIVYIQRKFNYWYATNKREEEVLEEDKDDLFYPYSFRCNIS